MKSRKLERSFQSSLIKELKKIFKDCIILKLDAQHKQGIPDLLILWGKNWAALECKRFANAKHQPNQDYYVKKMNAMSFSRFIYPENKGVILRELEQAFGLNRNARVSGCK